MFPKTVLLLFLFLVVFQVTFVPIGFSPFLLAPSSVKDQKQSIMLEEAEALLFKNAVFNLNVLGLKNVIPFEQWQKDNGILAEIKLSELPVENGLNILLLTGADITYPLLPILKNLSGVNVVLVPQASLNSYFVSGNQKKHLHCQFGIAINKNGELIYGSFEKPLKIHAGFLPGVESDLLEEIGFPVLVGSSVRSITDNKIIAKNIFKEEGLLIPSGIVIEQDYEREELVAIVKKFLMGLKGNDFVVKPTVGSGGVGARMFHLDGTELEEVLAYIDQLLQEKTAVLLETRIIPPLLKSKWGDTILDWNIRTLVTRNEEGEFELAGIEVRAKTKDGEPVNVHQGAQVYEIDEILDRVGLSLREKKEVLEQIKRVSFAASKAIAKAAQKDPFKKGSSTNSSFFGVDLILDKNFQPYVIEINSGNVGGARSLFKIREKKGLLEEQTAPAKMILDRLIVLGKRYKESSRNETEDYDDKIFIQKDEVVFWKEATRLFGLKKARGKELYACKKVLKMMPDDVGVIQQLISIYFNRKEYQMVEKYMNQYIALMDSAELDREFVERKLIESYFYFNPQKGFELLKKRWEQNKERKPFDIYSARWFASYFVELELWEEFEHFFSGPIGNLLKSPPFQPAFKLYQQYKQRISPVHTSI